MSDPDPIEIELMRNLFEGAAAEMGAALERVGFSANIKERRDFSCALFTTEGELLAQAAHIPVHLGSMPMGVRAVLDRLGHLQSGDAAIVNDPYAGGTHLPDITVVSLIVCDGTRVGYAANRAHHADVGGDSPGSMTLSTHIDQEGLRLEPTLLMKSGSRVEATWSRIREAVRTPDEREGDLEAQLVANAVGARAIGRLVASRGTGAVARAAGLLLDYARRTTERLIASLPDAECAAEDFLDDDGVTDAPVAVRVRLTKRGSRVSLDFTRSDDQRPGCVNCPEAVTRSACYYCFGCLLDADVPLNGGCFAPIEVVTRPGSVVAATYPAAVVAGNTETSQRVVDVVLKALHTLVPDRIPAASGGTMSSVAIGGTHDGRPWTYYETIGCGSGAGASSDGFSAVQCHMTNTLNTPAEAIELQYPLRITRFEIAAETGGRGAQSGGDGITRIYEALDDCDGTLLTDRRVTRPHGINDGEPGAAGCNQIVRASGDVEPLAGKTTFHLARGDQLHITTPGGGGSGSP